MNKNVLALVILLLLISFGIYVVIDKRQEDVLRAPQTIEKQEQTTSQSDLSFLTTPEKKIYERYALFSLDNTNEEIECSLDNDPFKSCDSKIFIPDIDEGVHTFSVRSQQDKEQVLSYEWEVLDIFESGTSDLIVSNQIPDKAEPRSWKGIIRINCDFSHSSYNDPVVHPRIEGAAHLHRFYGNELVDHNTTMESLITLGSSTCQGNELNRSGYWIPALLAPSDNEEGWSVVPAVVGTNEVAHEVFYYSAGIDDVDLIQPVPVGLRMIAGDAATKPGRNQDTSVVRWHCQSWESTDAGNPRWSTTIPECAAPDRVRMDIFFPSCWNGRDLDSADHKSHMAYPIKDSVNQSVCPSSHPVPIVRPSYHYAFGVKPDVYDSQTKTSRGWRLASDDYTVSSSQAGGLSLHGDWYNAWHPTIMEAMLETCIKGRYDCHNGNLANGWRLIDAQKGEQAVPLIINNGAGTGHADAHSYTTTQESTQPTDDERKEELRVQQADTQVVDNQQPQVNTKPAKDEKPVKER